MSGLWSLRRFIAILVIVGFLGSMIPQNQTVYAQTTFPSDTSVVDTSDKNLYQSYDIDSYLVPITSEDISLRTESEKVFRKVDGTYEVALYKEPIHYLFDGVWQNIDNTLTYNPETDTYENQANKYSVKFPKYLDENKQIKLSMGNYSIDWQMLGISRSAITVDNSTQTASNIKELTKVNQSLWYSNILPNIDLEYTLSGTSVKENIILNEYDQETSFSFEYKLKGLSIRQDSEGFISFVD